MSDMADRMSRMEQEQAVMHHRLRELEATPPRINTLENTVTHLQVRVETISSDIAEIKTEGKDTHRQVLNLRDDVKRLFTIGVVVVTLISAAAALVSLYDTWLAINQKTQDVNHAARTNPGLSEL